MKVMWTKPTGILYVLISTLGDVSGCHINPYVSLSFFLRRELSGLELVLYIVCQVAGGIVGAFMAHGMFKGCTNTAPEKCITSGRAVGKFDGKDRSTDGEFFSEIVATFLLLFIILSCLGRRDKERIPMAVGLYIQAGYFFTSSTSFANGAVTIGRMFTDSFASIAPSSAGRFIAGQLIGVILVLPFFSFLQEQKLPADSIAVLLRRRKICCPKPASSNSLGHTA